MNLKSDNISRLDKIEAGQKQFPQRQPDCSRNGVEGKNDFRDDDPLVFPAGGMSHARQRESHAIPQTFDLGKLGSERVENMGRLDNRDLPNLGSHTNSSARAGWSHGEQRNDMRAATKQRSNPSGWLIAPKNFEVSLEEAMELSFRRIIHRASIPNEGADQDSAANRAQNKYPEFNQCSASEGGRAQNTNRETIPPVNSPIALAGRSCSPREAANNSTGALNSAGARKIPAGFFSPPFFFTSNIVPTAVSACLDTKQHSEGVIQNVGQGFQ